MGEIEIRAKLSPSKAGAWAELGKNAVNSEHFVPGSARKPLGPKVLKIDKQAVLPSPQALK